MHTGNFASYLELLYIDTVRIYRQEKITNPDGTSDNVSGDVLSTAKCRVSYKKIDAPYEVDLTGEPIIFELKVICGPDVPIKAGDYLAVTRFDPVDGLVEYTGYAGAPAKYGTHQEVLLIHRKRA
jgi:hypothetical protein